MRVAIVSAHNNASLCFARSLARAGHQVMCVGLAGRRNFVLYSRACQAKVVVPDPRQDIQAFLSALRNLDFDAAVACSEDAALVMAGQARVIGPDPEVFKRFSDKLWVAENARKHGLTTPKTLALDRSGLEGFIRENWPVVLKTRFSFTRQGNRLIKGGAWSPMTPAQALDLAQHNQHLELIAQHRVSGEARGVSVLVWQGKALAWFAHKRLRQIPASGGPSTAAISLAPDPVVLDRVIDFLTAYGFNGLAMVEFKGEHVIEVNPRPWGSMPLAVMAGVDFPRLLVDAFSGKAEVNPVNYRTGLVARHLKAEIARLRTLQHAKDVVKDSMRLVLPKRDFNLSWKDPAPGIMEFLCYLLRRD